MIKDYGAATIECVSVNGHSVTISYMPEGNSHPHGKFDVYLLGELTLEGIHNYEAGAIADGLKEAMDYIYEKAHPPAKREGTNDEAERACA